MEPSFPDQTSRSANSYSMLYKELDRLGVSEIPHLTHSLLSHLVGTKNFLEDWDCEPSICTAGLFHALYGTAGLDNNLVDLSERDRFQSILGEDAESLVYFYCACDRKHTYASLASGVVSYLDRFSGETFRPEPRQMKSFCLITLANEMEILSSTDSIKKSTRVSFSNLFRSLTGYVGASKVHLALDLLASKNQSNTDIFDKLESLNVRKEALPP